MSPFPAAAVAHVVEQLRAAGCVLAEAEAALLTGQARTHDELTGLVDRRVAGEPLEHVLGWAAFAEVRVDVEPGVFVPRHRSEALVDHAVALAGRRRPVVVVDLCCGTGALGLVVATRLGAPLGVELHAADLDPAAVRCARRNLAAVGARVHEGDLFAALPVSLRGRIDILLANVPYVPSHEIVFLPTEFRVHETRGALDGGPDGLDVFRRVASGARAWLAPGGHLSSEIAEVQTSAAVAILRRAGLAPSVVHGEDVTLVVGSAPS